MRARPSRRCSRRSTTDSRTSRCWPTSTSRCCRRSPRATPTRSGSCRRRSGRPSRDSARRSVRSRASRRTPRARAPGRLRTSRWREPDDSKDRDLAVATEEVRKAIAAAEAATVSASRPRDVGGPAPAPAAPPQDPTSRQDRPPRESLGARRRRPRGRRGRVHQHRRRVGHADHVPDPARLRRPSGHGQRVQQHRPGAGLGQRRPRDAAGARGPAASGAAGWRPASVVGGLVGAVLLLVLPSEVFDAVVPALVALGILLVAIQPLLNARLAATAGGARRPRDGVLAARRTRGGCGRATALVGVYGGYFGAAQGIMLMGVLGAGLDDSLHRQNALKNVLASVVNAVAAVVFILVADVDWSIAGAHRSRVGHRRPGRCPGRPAAARRACCARSSSWSA